MQCAVRRSISLLLTLQFVGLATLLQCKRANWQWFDHASHTLAWLYSTLRVRVMEGGYTPPTLLPLSPFLGLPCTHPVVPRLHAVTPAFIERVGVSIRYLRSLDLTAVPPLTVGTFAPLMAATPFITSLTQSYNAWVGDDHLQALAEGAPCTSTSPAVTSSQGKGWRLTRLPLISLDLSAMGLQDVDLEPLALLPSLLSLSLSSNRGLTPDLSSVTRCPIC